MLFLNANYEIWLKRDLWSLSEAIFLMLGKEPLDKVYPQALHHFDPDFAKQYEDYIGIAQVAIDAGNLKPFSQNDGVTRQRSIQRFTPVDIINWANLKGLHIHPEISNHFSLPSNNINLDSINPGESTIRKRKPIERENSALIVVHDAIDALEKENRKTPTYHEVFAYLLNDRDKTNLVVDIGLEDIKLSDLSTITKKSIRKQFRSIFPDD